MRRSESYRALFELAKENESQAEEISLLIPGGALDLPSILRYVRANNSDEVRHLAEKMAKRIPKDCLDQGLLVGLQTTIDYNVRQLSRTLALSIPTRLLDPSILQEHLFHKSEYVKWLAEKLMKRYINSLKRIE